MIRWLKYIWRKIRHFLIRLLQDKEAPEHSTFVEPAKAGEAEVIEETATPISRQPGLNCPRCGTKIQVTADALLSGSPLICQCCALVLNVDREASKPVLQSLEHWNNAIKAAKAQNS